MGGARKCIKGVRPRKGGGKAARARRRPGKKQSRGLMERGSGADQSFRNFLSRKKREVKRAAEASKILIEEQNKGGKKE